MLCNNNEGWVKIMLQNSIDFESHPTRLKSYSYLTSLMLSQFPLHFLYDTG